MCGIAGIFLTKQLGESPSPREIRSMTDALEHRGPDGSGLFENKRIALGHRRLSIIDLSANGAQPMFNEDRSLVLVFNGEIYNFRKLRAMLEIDGHTFNSNSDGEVILHLFEKYGSECVQYLEGMFAFCIYDLKEQSIFLARDRVGEKPLFYASLGDYFYFASEIKSFLSIGHFPKRLSACGIRAYFNYHQIPAPATIYEGIEKVRPAHWMQVNTNGVRRTESYWDVEFADKLKLSDEESLDNLQALMTDSVIKMSTCDVSIGVLLSGGVDSSLILAIAKDMGVKDLNAFTVANLQKNVLDEDCIRAKRIASYFGVSHHIFDFGSPSFDELVDCIISCDEPIGMPEICYQFGIFRKLNNHTKVVLTGNGADELFGGYTSYNRIKQLSASCTVLAPLFSKRNQELNTIAARYHVRRTWSVLSEYFIQKDDKLNIAASRLLSDSMSICHYDSLLDAKLFADLAVMGNHAVSSIPDIGGMRSAVEVRSPFLHHKIIEFAASLPASLKVRDFFSPLHNKNIVKQLLSKYVHPQEVYARKFGFGYFINCFIMMRTTWRDEIELVIFDPALNALDLFDFKSIKTIWARFLDDKLEYRERLTFTRYVVFAIWYRYYFLKGLS
jgi:asparagine synthase (glutamine-hydrolysing)